MTIRNIFLLFSRAWKYTVPVLIGLLMIIPGINAQPGVGTSTDPADESTLLIDIITPQENEFILSDVVPHHIWVTGMVKSPLPLQSVIVSSSQGSTNCGNQSSFGCDVAVAKGAEKIAVTATDMAGNHVFRTRNIRVETGMPDLPLRITISGKITAPDGDPIEGATIRTEFFRTYDTQTVTVKSETDGSYRINNAHGYRQNMSVEKEGYLPVSKEIVFSKNVNTADFTLYPTTKSTPGFAGIVCLYAILMTAILIIHKKTKTL